MIFHACDVILSVQVCFPLGKGGRIVYFEKATTSFSVYYCRNFHDMFTKIRTPAAWKTWQNLPLVSRNRRRKVRELYQLLELWSGRGARPDVHSARDAKGAAGWQRKKPRQISARDP